MRAAQNTNECPTPEQRLVSPEECAAAVEPLGIIPPHLRNQITPEDLLETMKEEIEENGPESDYPKGCYGKQPMYSPESPHFNTHATGAAQEYSAPICFASVEIAARERCTGTWTNDACVTR